MHSTRPYTARRQSVAKRKSFLSASVAASVLALALSQMPAIADGTEPCGVVVNGQVVCDGSGNPFADGIRYEIAAPAPVQDLTVHLEDVAVQTNGNMVSGIEVHNSTGGAVTISGTGSVTTTGAIASGVGATAIGGVTIDIGDVTTTGSDSDAIFGGSNDTYLSGDVSIKAGTVTTSGFGANGIGAQTQQSNINIKAGTVQTSGDYATAVIVSANYGDVSVDIGTVSASGVSSGGIAAFAQGTANVKADTVTTSGHGGQYASSGAIKAVGTQVNVDVGSVVTTGDYAVGIYAGTNPASYDPTVVPTVIVSAGTVATSGNNSHGIVAINAAPDADAVINAGSVVTSGNNAIGIYSLATSGTAVVNAGSVTTSGEGSAGIVGVGYGGNVDLTVDSVLTSGAGADGVYILGSQSPFQTGTAKLNASSVVTTGDVANAITAHAAFSDLSLHADSVTTSGVGSYGVYSVVGSGGPLGGLANSVEIGSVTTTAENATGIFAGEFGTGNIIDVKAGSVVTSGAYAFGVYSVAEGLNNDISIDVGSVVTSGANANGINVKNYSVLSDNQIKADDITVSGDHAAGIFAYTYVGNISVDAKNVKTTGYAASGIGLVALYGDVSVKADTVTTTAISALGINVSGTNATVTVGSVISLGTGLDGEGSTGIIALAKDHSAVTAGSVTTNGDFATGIFVFGETSEVNVGSVTTAGDGSVGIIAQASSETGTTTVRADSVVVDGYLAAGIDALANTIKVTAGKVTTRGLGGVGIRATAYNDITIVGSELVSTEGAGAVGILANTQFGDVDVTASQIATSGDYAAGVAGLSLEGATNIKAGVVTTTGTGAVGIFAAGGSGVNVRADAVITSGEGANGIDLTDVDTASTDAEVTRPSQVSAQKAADTTDGITLLSGMVKTSGDGAIGIKVDGAGNVAVAAGATSAEKAEAIHLQAKGRVDLGLSGATITGAGAAVFASGSDVNVTLGNTANIAGPLNGLVVAANGPDTAFDGESTSTAAQLLGSGLVTVTNGGRIVGGEGFAVLVKSGQVKLANSGRIDGAVALAEGDDLFANSGVFNASKDSDFGGGSDTFVNTGTVNILPGSVAGGTVTFLGLERFENTGGLLNLSNGHVGDALVLPGEYVASGDARLALDISPNASDRLMVAGKASGKTTVLLTGLTPQTATLTGNAASKLIQVGAGSTASFDVGNSEIGLIHYGLKFDAASNSYSLAGSAGSAVYGNLKLVEGVQTLWSDSADAWSSHLASLRGDVWGNGARRTSKGNVWGQAYSTSGNREDEAYGFVTRYGQDNSGAQIGTDFRRGETLIWGVTGGYAKATMAFDGVTQKADISLQNIGAYGTWQFDDSYFANGLVKYDHYQIKASSGAAAYQEAIAGNSFGLQAEIGRRFGSERFAFEPVAGVTWVRSSLEDLKINGQTLAFDGTNGLTVKLGGRFSGRYAVKVGNAVIITAGLSTVQVLASDERLTFTSAGTSQKIVSNRDGTFGQALLGLTYRTRTGFSGYFEGSSDFGNGNTGTTLRMGARVQF